MCMPNLTRESRNLDQTVHGSWHSLIFSIIRGSKSVHLCGSTSAKLGCGKKKSTFVECCSGFIFPITGPYSISVRMYTQCSLPDKQNSFNTDWNTTPYELLYLQPVDYTPLQIFGSLAFASTLSSHRTFNLVEEFVFFCDILMAWRLINYMTFRVNKLLFLVMLCSMKKSFLLFIWNHK